MFRDWEYKWKYFITLEFQCFFLFILVARKMKKKEKQKKRKAYEPKLTPEGNISVQLYNLQFYFPTWNMNIMSFSFL